MRENQIQIKSTEQERAFVAYINEGISKKRAFELAFAGYNDNLDTLIEKREKASFRSPEYWNIERKIANMARDKFITKRIKILDEVYSDKMAMLSGDAVDTFEDLMLNSRSDLVRLDAAKTVYAYKEGTPTQRQELKTTNEYTIILGQAPVDKRDRIKVANEKRKIGNEMESDDQRTSLTKKHDPLIIDASVLEEDNAN